MCGIAGIIKTTELDIPVEAAPRVLECLEHRGPDDLGYLVLERKNVRVGRRWQTLGIDPELVFLHRRLAILDLSPAGAQPMASHDGNLQIIFNGEIYNYVELRSELETLGYRFHSGSDTEVMLAGFTEWGIEALRRFVGMFALALLDVRHRRVLLARDFFGIKPLYYINNGAFAFASELKALLEFDPSARRVEPSLLYLFLRFGVSGHDGGTLFSEIKQLPPGHYLEIPVGGPCVAEPKPYWTPSVQERADISFERASEKLRELFLENIRIHLRSDVPIGAALSGGIDSSAVVMGMRYLDPKLELNTFSFIADDASISEERWVDVVAGAAGARVHKIRATGDELVSDLDALTRAHDEPLASTSPYAQYRVFQRAREAGIKVMLDGQGADEILAGYRYYIAARLASLVRGGEWGKARRMLQRAARRASVPTYWLLMKAGSYLLPAPLQPAVRRLVGQDVMPSWMSRAWFRNNGVEARPVYSLYDSNVLRSTLVQELTATSLPALLRYEDRNSMAFSIESRVPFLTPQLVNFVLSLPEEYILAEDGTSKAVFRRAMRGIVPDRVLDRRDKIGFATPEHSWLQAVRPWVDKVLRSDAAAVIPALNRTHLTREWEHVVDGHSGFRSHFWRALNLIRWTEHFRVSYA